LLRTVETPSRLESFAPHLNSFQHFSITELRLFLYENSVKVQPEIGLIGLTNQRISHSMRQAIPADAFCVVPIVGQAYLVAPRGRSLTFQMNEGCPLRSAARKPILSMF